MDQRHFTGSRNWEVRSMRNRTWEVPELDKSRIKKMIEIGVPPAVAPILVSRGMSENEALKMFEPTLKASMPNPHFFKDMDKAVGRLVEALESGEKIGIWSDYDVDGATSASILMRFLGMLGISPLIHIPDRIEEGYGPNIPGFQAFKDQDVNLIYVLDSGTVAFDPLRYAADNEIDIVVIDHHNAKKELPPAVAIVNPNRCDQEAGFGHLCAAGMTFMFCVAANAYLRDSGWLGDNPDANVDLMSLLDLVALGTVADVVPLQGLNRAFVTQGLKRMNSDPNLGIKSLLNVADIEGEVTSYHCGFILGPRINAAGRVGTSTHGTLLLSSDDPDECLLSAIDLDKWNRERREKEKRCVEEAICQIEDLNEIGSMICVQSDDWHPGVIGIVASRLKDLYDRPAFVFSTSEGHAVGSGRSVPGFNLGNALMKAHQEGILVKGGGHAMAGGATIKQMDLAEFQRFMSFEIEKSEFGANGLVTRVDMKLPLEMVSVGFANLLSVLEPYGQGNERAKFLITDGKIKSVTEFGGSHLKVILVGPGNRHVDALAFNAANSSLFNELHSMVDHDVEVLGTIDTSIYGSKETVSIFLEDIRSAQSQILDGSKHSAVAIHSSSTREATEGLFKMNRGMG